MVEDLAKTFSLPAIAGVYFPPFHKGGQPSDAQFMAVRLEGGATGISYVLLSDEKMNEYSALQPPEFVAQNPRGYAHEYGCGDPIKEMIALASINAICQHVMRETDFAIDSATDSLGLLSISRGDRIGMVGLFSGLNKTIEKVGADLVVVEKNENLIQQFPNLSISLDPSALSSCNKILCTSTTLFNNSLDEILAHCSPDAFVSIIGPTAGFFPDPLFARGVNVVGGRLVEDDARFWQLLTEGKRWGKTTRKTCFQKNTYAGFDTGQIKARTGGDGNEE